MTDPDDLAAFSDRVGRWVLLVGLLIVAFIVVGVMIGNDDEDDPTPNEICRERVENSGLSVFTPQGEALERACLDGFE